MSHVHIMCANLFHLAHYAQLPGDEKPAFNIVHMVDPQHIVTYHVGTATA